MLSNNILLARPLKAAKTMLENTIKWRREYRPDQLDPDYIRPEVGLWITL